MKVSSKTVYNSLEKIFQESPSEPLTERSKWVIFSDLHMGDGGSTDDFKANSSLFTEVLSNYYLDKKYGLFLNGDVEELQRFSLKSIVKHWTNVYKIFDRFDQETRLIKTIGNHDLEIQNNHHLPYAYFITEGYRFTYGADDIFLFHGHQASKKYQRHNKLIGFTLKYFANPLGIKSYSVSHDSKKQYNIEKRVYHYAAYYKRISIIGHTHRPLFESLHKVERLKYTIEQLCREYADGNHDEKIEETIRLHKKELRSYYKQNEEHNYQNYVYNTIFHIPCVFNSGTVVGKRGMTCIEIADGKIRLVHWFDKNISPKYLSRTGYTPEQLPGTDFYRMVINEETLEYIFTRIKFLA